MKNGFNLIYLSTEQQHQPQLHSDQTKWLPLLLPSHKKASLVSEVKVNTALEVKDSTARVVKDKLVVLDKVSPFQLYATFLLF